MYLLLGDMSQSLLTKRTILPQAGYPEDIFMFVLLYKTLRMNERDDLSEFSCRLNSNRPVRVVAPELVALIMRTNTGL